VSLERGTLLPQPVSAPHYRGRKDGRRVNPGFRIPFLLLAVSTLVYGCATSSATDQTASTIVYERFRVLTYNTLHGLEVGEYWVRPGESEERRTQRFKLQFQQLAEVQPEVMLLQEVNPLPKMAEAYINGLKEFGLQYSEVHQVDACGVRLGLGPGLIPNLNNGLAVLVKAPLVIRRHEGLKLSGGFGGCRDVVGFQTGELRYAVIADVINPGTKKKILAVSVHLHSGIERDEFFLQQIKSHQAEGRIPDSDVWKEIQAALTRGQERRLEEVRTLLTKLRELQAEEDYVAVIIGGDFNFEAGSPEYRELEQAGLQDTFMNASQKDAVFTYDPNNPLASQEEAMLPPELNRLIADLPESEQADIIRGYREGISHARRIDFLFLMPNPSSPLRGCVKQKVFGKPTTFSLHPGSDHYGVLDTFIFDPRQC
jgi:endonuclease/exonuclease/phosphatase family metal-dependent hydrolase